MSTNYSTQAKGGLLTRQKEPYQFMMWLGLAGSSLIFITLIAISFIRRESLGWTEISMPGAFWLSSLLIFSSSVTLFEAVLAFRTERFRHYRICLALTFILGVIFTITQSVGWLELFEMAESVSNKSSLSFVYLITGLHFLHILGADGSTPEHYLYRCFCIQCKRTESHPYQVTEHILAFYRRSMARLVFYDAVPAPSFSAPHHGNDLILKEYRALRTAPSSSF